MGDEQRRAPRIESTLKISLILRDDKENATLSDSIPAQILDVSVYGVRISVSRVRFGDYHLFYSFNDSPDHLVQICANEAGEDIVVPAYPVWFDHLVNAPGQPFQLGMEFLIEPQDENVRKLNELVRLSQKGKGGWLKSMFGKK